tara:strand:+ start:5521 stop:7062 length:1542 start_codon:yes stop_codon:yes gene_type:complete
MTNYTAPFFNELYQIKYAFSTGVFNTLAPSMLNLLRTGATLYITLIFFSMIFQPEKGKERAEGLKVSIACFVLAILLLSQTGTTSNVLDVFWAIEDMSLAISVEILRSLPTYGGGNGLPYPLDTESAKVIVGGETVVNGYAVLASLIEQQMLDILAMMKDIASRRSSTILSPGAVTRVVMCILGMLPFLFVLGIFAAFMAEAMFKYVAMATATPILITLYPVKFFRPFATAGIRILIGAFFTLVFAAGAMGFTIVAIDNFKKEIEVKLATSRTSGVESLAYRVWCDPGYAFDLPRTALGSLTYYTQSSPGMEAEKMDAKQCSQAQELANEGDWIVLSPPYLMLIVVGFLSVLLHLSAKTLASNISGANDGPGPAAAVVMGAKMAAGGGAAAAIKYGGGAMFGRGGAGASVSDIMRGNKNVTAGGAQGLGQSLAAHGAVGTAIGAFNPFRGGEPPSPDTGSGMSNIGSNRFSTGGGNGSMFGTAQEQQQFAAVMTKSFVQAMRENGMGRNRDGS